MNKGIPVNRRALTVRIGRRLAAEGKALKAARGGFFIVDLEQGAVISSHADLEQLGRETGILKPYEQLED